MWEYQGDWLWGQHCCRTKAHQHHTCMCNTRWVDDFSTSMYWSWKSEHQVTPHHFTSHHMTSHHRRSMKCVSFISWKVVCKSSNASPRHSSPSSRSVVLIDQSYASVMLFPSIVTSTMTITILWFNFRTLSLEYQPSIELRVMLFFFFFPSHLYRCFACWTLTQTTRRRCRLLLICPMDGRLLTITPLTCSMPSSATHVCMCVTVTVTVRTSRRNVIGCGRMSLYMH